MLGKLAISGQQSHSPEETTLADVTTSNYFNPMKAAGIKDLKARLSEYIRAVRSGETVLVTDRNEVVAEIRPVPRRPLHAGTMEAVLDSLAAAGEITRAQSSRAGWTWEPRSLGLPPGTAGQLLDEIREDR
jgi:prevent-host-death family protein